jgi:hypothetical protein
MNKNNNDINNNNTNNNSKNNNNWKNTVIFDLREAKNMEICGILYPDFFRRINSI